MMRCGAPCKQMVLATPASLSKNHREILVKYVRELGVHGMDFYDQSFFASKLRRDGYWRSRLLHLSGEPLSLSAIPMDLAENQWSNLELIGRDSEISRANGISRDLIITGPPGVGKTRFAAAVKDIAFIDATSEKGTIADDMRYEKPSRVVIDDAGLNTELVKAMAAFRKSESDILDYQIITVCWPEDEETLVDILPESEIVRLRLLNVSEINQILESMGITGILAREEIIPQAAGRPGWAIALGDIVVHQEDVKGLLDGRALLGQVKAYFRKSGIKEHALATITLIAALGGISEHELDHLSACTGIARNEISDTLQSVARNGLVDVGERESARRYTICPEMLGRALVAEQSFLRPVPVVDLLNLAKSWPDRILYLAKAACCSFLMGAERARPVAQALVGAVEIQEGIPYSRKLDLRRHYARMDIESGKQVLDILWREYAALLTCDNKDQWVFDPILEIASDLVSWYSLQGAAEMLFDSALRDTRNTNANPGCQRQPNLSAFRRTKMSTFRRQSSPCLI